MSFDMPVPTGEATPLEVMRRWDESGETRYSLNGDLPTMGPLGMEYLATAVDPGGLVRTVRVLVLSTMEADSLRSRIHDDLTTLRSLNNPNIGAVEATVRVEQEFGLVVKHHDAKMLTELLEGGPLPARSAAEIGLEVAWGLASAHQAVSPGQLRPVAIPHGSISAENVSLSGLAEVVLTDYNVWAARSHGANTADDVFLLGQLMVHLLDGEPMPALPVEPDAARRAVEDDLGNLDGLTDDFRQLLAEMLDPELSRRPEVRSVARRLRRLIPHQDGLWLSAWAESTIGLPERSRPAFEMPTPALVEEDPFGDEGEGENASDGPRSSGPRIESTPPLVRAGRRDAQSSKLRVAPGAIVAAGLVVLLLMGGGISLMRFWLPYFGDLDGADVATDEAGPDKAAAAGPVSSGGGEPNPDARSQGDTKVTVIQAEKGIDAPESDRERPERELVETDEAIDPQKSGSPIDDGTDAEADAAPPSEAAEPPPPAAEPSVGPPPWPRPAGTLGEYDLFVEVPLAEKVELRCTNGLSMTGPSAFRAAIMQSTPTRCVATATLPGRRLARTTIDLKQTNDLICRYGYGESLRCNERPTGRNYEVALPSDAELEEQRADIRVRIPLALTADIECAGGQRQSGIDVQWLDFAQVKVGRCTVEVTLPDGPFSGSFDVTQNGEFICLRDPAAESPDPSRRPIRCSEVQAL